LFAGLIDKIIIMIETEDDTPVMGEESSSSAQRGKIIDDEANRTMIQTLVPPLPRAPELLFANDTESKLYWDRSHYDSLESQMKALAKSSTLYIGNLAFSTRSFHVRSHFAQIGPVKNVVMGLDRFVHTPCGFCFVEYEHRHDALSAVSNLNATKLDGRVIRVDLDAGFQPGRQFGRGQSGGQVRDDKRLGVSDPGRNKRPKLNWIPPEHVRQQNQQEQHDQTSTSGVNDDPTLEAYGPGAMGGSTVDPTEFGTNGGDADMAGQAVNSRFRDES
jgi:nuclear cap-binding protein subunit 2